MIPASEFASLRSEFDQLLSHTCTLTPMTDGVEDAHGNAPGTPGSPTTAVPCAFDASIRTIRDETGTVIVSGPTLTVSAMLAISIGDQISAVTDVLGGTPPGSSGTFRVEHVADATAGLGAALLPSYILHAAAAVR